MTDLPAPSPLPGHLIARYRSWHALGFADNHTWYARLAEEGQRPRAMTVSCCDCRVNIVEMFGAEPGDHFVVRNVAGLIPPDSPDHQHHGTSAALEQEAVLTSLGNPETFLVVAEAVATGLLTLRESLS